MKLLKQSKESNIFNKLTGKRKEGRRTGKSSFPILLCVMIAIASALIQYSILSTVGGVDNSRGFSFHRSTSSTNAKTTPKGQTSNKSAKNKSETSTETELIDHKNHRLMKFFRITELVDRTYLYPVLCIDDHQGCICHVQS